MTYIYSNSFKLFFSLYHIIIFLSICHPFRITSEVSTARSTSAKNSSNSFVQFPNHEHRRHRTIGGEKDTRRSERPSRARRRNASTQPPLTLPQRALARGCPSDPVQQRRPDRVDLRDASPAALRGRRTHAYVAPPPHPRPRPRPCVWSCIFSLSAIAFICGGKRPMLHGHLHTLVNIGVEGFYIIAGSFEKDRRKGYISLWECAAAFYVVIRE